MSDNKSIKKSLLTPCRSVGLKRRSLGSPSVLCGSQSCQKTPSTPLSTSAKFKSNRPSKITASNDELPNQNVTKKLKFDHDNSCLSEKSVTPVAYPAEESSISNTIVDSYSQIVEKISDDVTVADLDFQISEMTRSLSIKMSRIKELESDLKNVKQHDLGTLKNLIRKWRAACQEGLNELLNEFKKQGKACTMIMLLNALGISLQLVRYSETEMDFYE